MSLWNKGDTSGDCPKCGYPTVGEYFGVYQAGFPCGKCGYLDKEAAKKLAEESVEREARVKRNRENPPQFKTVEDWENATHE